MGEDMIYDKLLFERILIGSYQLMSYWRQMNKWRHHEQRYNFSSDKTNRFYVAEDLYCNRSQKTSKYGKNLGDRQSYVLCANFLF